MTTASSSLFKNDNAENHNCEKHGIIYRFTYTLCSTLSYLILPISLFFTNYESCY